MEQALQLLSFLIGGIIISMICNEILLRFSQSLGIRNKNDVVVRWSNESKPSLGGVSFFIVFVFTSMIFSMVYFEDNIFHNSNFVGLMISGSLAFLMGLADDAYNTKPFGKLLVQILCGLTFVFAGINLDLFHIPLVDSLITIIWVVGIMNSLNMLDNMDGITGTTVLFILITCLISHWVFAGIIADVWSVSLIAMIGCILGFLKYNINPSRLFMGDAGSQFIGLFVAFFSVKYLWNVGSENPESTEIESWIGFVITLIAFTGAAADTFTVVINRLKKGKSPMVGGKDHTTHHLVYAGFNDKKVWYIFTAIGVFSTILAVIMITFLKKDLILPIVFSSVYLLAIFIMLYKNTIKYKAPNTEK